MGSPRLKALELGEAERAALETLAARRRTAQGLALRARIVLACAETGSPRLVGARLDVHPDTVRKWRHRFALDRLDGLRDGPRSGAPRKIGDERIEAVISRTLESLPADGTHWSSRGMARASGLSTATVQQIGAPSACSRTGSRPSSSRPTPTSSRRCATWSASTWPRRIGRWSCASTRKARSRHSTAPSRCCPCVRAKSNVARTTTNVTARPRCSRRSMLPPGGSSANASPGTEPPSSVASSTRSRRMSHLMSRSTSSWTTTPPTRHRRSATGCSSGRIGTFITRRPAPPGSTRWNGSSPC